MKLNDLKDFHKGFDFLLTKIKNEENFAFVRFSDGELFVLKNETLILSDTYYVTGDVAGSNIYTDEEQKEFIPEIHSFYRQKLIESLEHTQADYFKGICTIKDVGEKNFLFQKSFISDEENLTFANLLINKNYKRFVEEMVPLFKNREIIYVANKAAKVENLPFKIKKHFKVGKNCPVNDYYLVDEIRKYIKENNIKNHIILCAAASLSNYIIHQCYEENPNNTFIDVGSCLNPYLGLEGWKHTRGYLTGYWLNSGSPYA